MNLIGTTKVPLRRYVYSLKNEMSGLCGNETILEIIESAKSFSATYDWQCDEDKIEFIEAVDKLSEII